LTFESLPPFLPVEASVTDFTLHTAPIAIPFQDALTRLEEIGFADALWARRLDVWTSDPATQAKIANRLGWLNAIEFVKPHVPRLRAFADAVREEAFTDVILLGMGGSSLAPEVMRRAIGVAQGRPRFRVLDSVDPDAVRDAMANAATSLFILASKSGSTIEPNVMAAEAQRRLRDSGITNWASRFVAVTDEGTPAHRRAEAERFREIFVNPSDIGGRYSALSFFGMVPAAWMGIDLDALLSGASQMADACRLPGAKENPGLALGAFMGAAALAGRNKLTLLVPESLDAFGLWVEQLVAESTGKDGKGVVPVAGERPDAPFGRDRAVVAVNVGAEAPRGIDRAGASGAPSIQLGMPDALALGAEFFRWEVATATAGLLMGINPFDEPNVQQAKDATGTLLQAYSAERRLPMPEPHARVGGALLTLSNPAQERLSSADALAFLSSATPGDYVGLLAYLPPDDPTFADVCAAARGALGARTSCATVLGYGPRYLHSTGQLHKGGPNTGVFLIVTAEVGEDLPIPGEPFSFAVLEMAQAIGDFQSLDRAGRRALHVHLPRREPDLLARVIDALVSHA
jgi:glucose-6-phosphate isomerase/transaldolase/glucose-6-phosphate isomerase